AASPRTRPRTCRRGRRLPGESFEQRGSRERNRVRDDRVGVGAEPLLDQRRVDAAEVRRALHVAEVVEPAGADPRELADHATADARPDQEAYAGGAVV